MFFNFTFQHFLTNPQRLAVQLKTSSMRGFKIRIVAVVLIGILLFVTRELWGMNTEAITPLLSTMSTADYTLARYASLLGIVILALIYLAFHLAGFSYILAQVTEIPFKQLLPLQLLITSILLMEKALVFVIFVLTGTTTNVSFLSFGPLATMVFEIPFFIFFFNQLTVSTAVVIALQFKFITSYNLEINPKKTLWALIGIQLVMAALIGAVGFIPTENLFDALTGGGAANE